MLPPAIWLTRRVARMRRTITAQRQRHLADLHSQVEEGLSVSGVLLGKTLGAGPAQSRRFTGTSDDLVALEVRSQLAGRWRMATMSIVFAGIPALIYLAAGLPATSGGMTIGTLVAFTALQGTLFRPLMGLLDLGVTLTSSHGAVQPGVRVPRPAGRHRRPGRTRRVDPAAVRGEVRFEHVGFRYPDGAAAGADRRRPRPCPPAARSRWSATPARARARSPRWSPGSTTRRPAGC